MVRERNGDVWITPQEAAEKLGLSLSRIYHLKNKLTHRTGDTRSSRLYFLENRIFEEYLSI